MQLLEGKPVADFYKQHIAETVQALKEQQKQPALSIILVGNDAPSAMYAKSMQKIAKASGFEATIHALPETVAEDALLTLIQQLNASITVAGILLMMPLPAHIHTQRVINMIAPEKDVDGLTDRNIARLFSGRPALVPCTPQAVMAILHYYNIPLDGKHVVVLGRSNVVGKPVAQLCLDSNATVTICHSHTKDLAKITKTADILIAAVGKANFVTKDMVKSGAVVIDVGINRVNGKTVGDVDFTSVAAMASAITPVPGGVGAVTTTMVLANALMGVD